MTAPLSLSSRVRCPDHVLYRDLQDELVLLELKRGVYFGLDTVGTRIWHLLRDQRALHEVLATLVHDYDVTEAQGAEDILALVGELLEHGLVERCD